MMAAVLRLHVVPEEHDFGRVPAHRIVDRREARIAADAKGVRPEVESAAWSRRPALDVRVEHAPRLHAHLLALKPREAVALTPPLIIPSETDLRPRREVDGVVDGDREVRPAGVDHLGRQGGTAPETADAHQFAVKLTTTWSFVVPSTAMS